MTNILDKLFISLGVDATELIKIRYRKCLYFGILICAAMTLGFTGKAIEAFLA